jgi:hypothetical protein
VQKEILERHPTPNLRVYAVWFSMIPTDARSRWAWTGGVLDDSRVLHYWDEKKKVGRLFADKDPDTDDPDVVWDAYYIYGPEAQWPTSVPTPIADRSQPQPLLRSGATVRSDFEGLKRGLEPVLR